MKKHTIILLSIILLGIVVRIIGIDFGLPSLCHNDEPVVVNYALAYGQGDLNPHFFKVPPLLSYFLFFLYGIFFVAGKTLGFFQGVADFGYRFLSDPTAFYLIGRVFTGALFGTAAIPLMHVLGNKVFDKKTGLFAALFLALNFLHVRNSHYVYFDIPLVFFILLFFICLYYLYERNALKYYLISGFVLGIAISVKYSAALLLLPAFLVVIINGIRNKESFSAIVGKNFCAFSMLIFGMFLTNPFMFIDYIFFIDTISRMPFFKPPFWFHLKISLLGGTGLLMVLFSVPGAIVSLKKRNIFASVMLIFIVVYYLILTYSSQKAERYVFPMIPFILLFSGYFVRCLMDRFHSSRVRLIFCISICSFLIAPSLIKIYYCDRLFIKADTRQEAYQWVSENIPGGTKIGLDATGPLAPNLPQNREFIIDSFEKFNKPKFDVPKAALEYKVKLMMENPYCPKNVYDIYYLKRGPSKDRFLKTYPEVFLDVKQLKEEHINYVIVSSLLVNASGKLFIEELGKNAILLKEFSPYKSSKNMVIPREETVVPAAAFSIEELRDRERFGPVIRVYRLKK